MKIAKTVREILAKKFGNKLVEAPPNETVKAEIAKAEKEIKEAVVTERVGVLAEKKGHRYTQEALHTKARYEAYLKKEKQAFEEIMELLKNGGRPRERVVHHKGKKTETIRDTKPLNTDQLRQKLMHHEAEIRRTEAILSDFEPAPKEAS